MKNHFFIAYAGNKRNEVESLYNEIKDKLDNIEYIIEPFCGSSAFSYYLSTKHPKKFKYILNDNNKHLINLYDVGSKEEELDKLILKLNEFSKDNNKEKYNKIIKEDKFENWFYKNKLYCLRPGFYPSDIKRQKTNFSNIKKVPIIKFLMEEDIELYEEMGEDIIELYKNNTKALIFIDPPYLNSCNDFYLDSKVNIYEYLSINTIDKMEATILLCLENNWIIKLLFNNFIKSFYNKQYEYSKKNTTHLIISNK